MARKKQPKKTTAAIIINIILAKDLWSEQLYISANCHGTDHVFGSHFNHLQCLYEVRYKLS